MQKCSAFATWFELFWCQGQWFARFQPRAQSRGDWRAQGVKYPKIHFDSFSHQVETYGDYSKCPKCEKNIKSTFIIRHIKVYIIIILKLYHARQHCILTGLYVTQPQPLCLVEVNQFFLTAPRSALPWDEMPLRKLLHILYEVYLEGLGHSWGQSCGRA